MLTPRTKLQIPAIRERLIPRLLNAVYAESGGDLWRFQADGQLLTFPVLRNGTL